MQFERVKYCRDVTQPPTPRFAQAKPGPCSSICFTRCHQLSSSSCLKKGRCSSSSSNSSNSSASSNSSGSNGGSSSRRRSSRQAAAWDGGGTSSGQQRPAGAHALTLFKVHICYGFETAFGSGHQLLFHGCARGGRGADRSGAAGEV